MRYLSFVVWLLALPTAGFAQSFEAAVQLTGLHLHKIDEAPVGIGGRVHYNIISLVSADAEFTHYPANPSGNFGESAVLFGLRVGKRFDRVGFFAKARPGAIHFGGSYFDLRLDRKTHFILDMGGVLEWYATPRTFLRIDQGDTVIYYGSAKLFSRPNPDALGTVHNYQPGFGFGFRF